MPEFVAPFQREYKAWNKKMKISFIENIIKGHRTQISLYTLDKTGIKTNCYVLDGQHRLYAMLEFIEGKFKVFDNSFSYEDLVNEKVISFNQPVFDLKIFQFNTLKDAINFYIETNENITHSKSDINKAQSFLINYKNS